MQYDRMKIFVGMFVLLFFFSIFSFGYIFLQKKGVFSTRVVYLANTASAEYFSIGMPIKFSGFTIGTIKAIDLCEDGSVDMKISINEEHKRWITQDSILVLKKPLIGSAHLDLMKYSSANLLEEGGHIELIVNDGIEEMYKKLTPAIDSLVVMVSNLEKLTSELVLENSAFSQILINLEIFSQRLAKDNSLLTTFTGSNDATENIIQSIEYVKEILQQVDKTSQDLDASVITPMSEILIHFNLVLVDLLSKLERLDAIVDSTSELDGDFLQIKNQFEDTLLNANELLQKLNTILSSKQDSKVRLP